MGAGICLNTKLSNLQRMKNQPKHFQTKVFSWTSARHVCAKMLVLFFSQDLEGLTECLAGGPQRFLFGLIFVCF